MPDIQPIKDRLKAFISSLGISEREFEIKCGLSNGYIHSMRKGIGHSKIEQISNAFTNLNIAWLLTGEGEMLKKMPSDYEQTHKTGMAEEQYHCLECIKKQKIIDELIEKCELQKKLIYEYELQLEKRRKVDCG